MGLEFRRRDYRAEEQSHSLPRVPAESHPLSAPAPNPSPSPRQVNLLDDGKDDFFDPLRSLNGTMEFSANILQHEDIKSDKTVPKEIYAQSQQKEWNSFTKILMQRFPVSKTISISLVASRDMKGSKANEKSLKDSHLEELDDPQKFAEDVKVISQREYVSRLLELKDEIKLAWYADDRVTSLRLSIKVARLLMDTTTVQFYPNLFVLSTDIMDLLGDLVWNRIKKRAEFNEDGRFICYLPDNFEAADICYDAKETCNNWFCKIGSVRELLPRIYLELSMLHCWRFLLDHPMDSLRRLVMMIRGIADPLVSAYCRLYLVRCAQRLPQRDTGYLIHCINDLKVQLLHLISVRESTSGNFSGNSILLLSLIEPTIEYIIKCLFKDLNQMEIRSMLEALGMRRNQSDSFENCSCISIILHHILKELPLGFLCSNSFEMLHLIECTDDFSFEQCLNYKLLGFRLCERIPEVSNVDLIVEKIVQVISSYNGLDAYLKVVDAYLDIIFENQFETYLNGILDGIFHRAQEDEIGENELASLQSIFLKLLTHFANIEKILALNHFIDILDVMYGSSRNTINMHILSMATRNGCVQDPTVIEALFEISQALCDGVDFSNIRKDDYQHPAHLISRFVYMVDYGPEVEQHLTFLTECRAAFGSISVLQETLVHSSNNLAVKSIRDGNNNINFIKSCLAFNEVTIPSIHTHWRQLNLYLETAEVALLGGFISHSDVLIDAAVNCLRNVEPDDGLLVPGDVDGIISLICKLCGIMVMVPGSLEQGVACIPKLVLSILDTQSWMLPRLKIKVSCAIISLSAGLTQNPLPYHASSSEVMGNDKLFFGVPAYPRELLSFSAVILQKIVNIVLEEGSMVVRGKLALEACNSIASSFKMSDEMLAVSSKLLEIAKSCLSADDKYLRLTLELLHME
ncbi:UPF0505 protein isoform X2 [Olea europaea var. sylvestris]|uniref:UPF0505 protein isoform X1 n=1 Tax=Olea europaea var. sylvestris TaxID=158386 RepID=UPI000C1D0261|nr:UPF0505 protein isoform X1 [Olea europaea var. sylvestris]XP_022867448.1 UPF0505 protein isoform X2 [Olea europaea var. sylvestris]